MCHVHLKRRECNEHYFNVKTLNADLVRKALKIAHREDLIGNSKNCLVAPSYKERVEKVKQNNKKNNVKQGNKNRNTRNTKGKRR